MVQFYKDFGVGKLGLHKAFRIEKDENGKAQIVPITRIAHVRLDDLVGYEIPKQKLIENTEAFVRGRKANNCLLFGDAGTGKSSSIKGILNQYYDEGLRIIEAYKHQFQDLNEIIAQIKDRNYKFIIYMDDLSFEEFEIEYKYLKAVIEGGLERKPDNILIYATSNRRHLVRERAGTNWKLEIVTISTPLIPYRKNFLWYIVLAFVSTSAHRTARNSTRSSRHWQPVMASRCRKTSSLRKLANGRSLMEDLPEELHSSLLITFSEKRKTNSKQEGVWDMAITTFAAIDIGSYEISMKIFEFSKKIGFRELNDVRYRLEIGKGAYSRGRLEPEMVDDICVILKDFSNMMQEFGVSEYRACATSAFREIVNPVIVQEQIYQRTGIRIEILSNAEQHFLGYKSIAAIESGFKKIIQKGTAILDVGGGNLQVSLFDKDALVTTQSFKMGSMRIRERLKELEKTTTHYDQLIKEFIRNDLTAFQRLYLKDRDIKNVILMGDFLTDTIFREELGDHIITSDEFTKRYEKTIYKTEQALARRWILIRNMHHW